jgi:hypothetical protein
MEPGVTLGATLRRVRLVKGESDPMRMACNQGTRLSLIGITALCLFVTACEVYGTGEVGYDEPYTGPVEHVVIDDPNNPVPAVLYGTVAMTVYAPEPSEFANDTETFLITLRSGGIVGPVVLESQEFSFGGDGVEGIDLLDVAYGYYDVSIVGLDGAGNAVSFAAAGVTVDEPVVTAILALEPTSLTGDVVLNLQEPDGGLLSGPITTLDYSLWERDSTTGELLHVQEMLSVAVDLFDMPIIEDLLLGDYTIQITAYDAFGQAVYEFVGDFTHESKTTFLPVVLWDYAP